MDATMNLLKGLEEDALNLMANWTKSIQNTPQFVDSPYVVV
jgi:hypothetical protein